MFPNNATPSQMVIPANATGELKRRLVLRNPLEQALVLKLVTNPKNDAVQLSHYDVRVPPRKFVQVDVMINAVKLGTFSRVAHQIKGYAKLSSDHDATVKWIQTAGAEKERQLAFSIDVKSTSEFSAYDTIIDLPGRACLIEATNNGRVGVDDMGVRDAIRMDQGTYTAREFGSMEDVVEGLRKAKMPAESCWLWDMATKFVGTTVGVPGVAKEPVKAKKSKKSKKSKASKASKTSKSMKSMKSAKSQKSSKLNSAGGFNVAIAAEQGQLVAGMQAESSYINAELNQGVALRA